MTEELARLVLDRIERLEAQRLSWGLVDGGFSKDEILALIGAVIEEEEEAGRDLWVGADDVFRVLLDQVLLWRTPETPPRFRSRSAEAVRLFARLRQMFKPEHWRSGSTLVSDFRYQITARRFPRREHAPNAVAERLADTVSLSSGQRRLLDLLLHEGTETPLRLSEFQLEAAEAILSGLHLRKISATVIAAGTGSGKTLAFLLPTLLHLGIDRDEGSSARSVAVYPRNELLKDQLRAIVEALLPIHADMTRTQERPITVGALFGSVPEDLAAVRNPRWGWKRQGAGGRTGYVCPFLRCPQCDGALVWREQEIRAASQALTCTTPDCGLGIPAGLICLTRRSLRKSPPDILLTSTEMMNRSMSDPRMRRLIGVGTRRGPRVLLLDEIHTYTGGHGAQVGLLLRRWRRLAKVQPHIIGLSATLADASRFMSELTGVFENNVRVVEPSLDEMETRGSEYTLALRGDPVSETTLLSTTIQSAMLASRILDSPADPVSGGVFGTKVFAFGDDLDVINRLHDNLADAEGTGWRARRRVLGSLANLRSPSLQPSHARWADGQGWDMVADIGHRLAEGDRRRIGRVSSQDRGVDRGVATIVATASLEVGFDDPAVGAVIQHKAPRDPAAYIQRRGRAGRSQVMRPWTIVVLSDFGRDRMAYQRYEELFDPRVRGRFLPVHNPFVLKIQATFALLDWIGARVSAETSESAFSLLSRPRGAPQWYREAAALLKNALEDPSVEIELRDYLQTVLEIDAEQASRVLWDAPRSLMLEVIPTILRRIETRWHGEEPEERAPTPLPEFLPSALFADLNVPELMVRLPNGGEERMPFRQGLSEFAPGRVSRRFGAEREEVAHWVPVPFDEDETSIVDLGEVLDRDTLWELGSFEPRPGSADSAVRALRPRIINVEEPPRNVSATAKASLIWRTQVRVSADGHEIGLPPLAAARVLLSDVRGFLHTRGCPVEIRRFAIGVEADTTLSGGGSRPPRRYEFAVDGDRVALGFAQSVDALVFRPDLPDELGPVCVKDQVLLRHLRVLRFRDRLQADGRMKVLANRFQIDWLSDAVLAAVVRAALSSGRPVSELVRDDEVMAPSNWIGALSTIFDLPEETGTEEDDAVDEGEGNVVPHAPGNRRFHELATLLSNKTVGAVVEDALPALYGEIDDDWEPWLRKVAHETMAAALLTAVQALVNDVAFDDLRVDVLPTQSQDSLPKPPEEFEVWISEDTPGGVGMVERVVRLIQSDPQRFLALLETALEATDAEQARSDLGQVSAWLGSKGDDFRRSVADAAEEVRESLTHQQEAAAFQKLKVALSECGLILHQTTLSAVNLRLLRPGSSSRTDELHHTLWKEWEEAESVLGFEVNPRVFAEVRSHDDSIDDLLESVTEGVPAPEDRRRWRFSVLNGLLWPSHGTIRAAGLRYYNPFIDTTNCDRLILTGLIGDDLPAVDASDARWRDTLSDAIRKFGTADLVASPDALGDLRRALLSITLAPLDVGVLSVHPRVRGFNDRHGRPAVRLEVPEIFGMPGDG